MRHRLGIYLAPSHEAKDPPALDRPSESSTLSNRARLSDAIRFTRVGVESWAPVLRFVFAQGVLGLGVMVVRKWLRGRDHRKVL